MKNYLLIIMLIFSVFLVSCKCKKTLTSDTKTIVNERVVEVVRDSIVTLPADISLLKLLLECDSIGKVHIKMLLDYEKGEQSNVPKVNIDDNNVLTADCECDSTAIYLTWKERFSEIEKSEAKNETETITINELKTWQKGLMWFGVVFILIIIYSIYKFIKQKINGKN